MDTHKVLLEVPRLGGDPSGCGTPILLTDGPPAWWARFFVWGPSARTTGQAAWGSKELGLPPQETFGTLHLCKWNALQHVDEVLEKSAERY